MEDLVHQLAIAVFIPDRETVSCVPLLKDIHKLSVGNPTKEFEDITDSIPLWAILTKFPVPPWLTLVTQGLFSKDKGDVVKGLAVPTRHKRGASAGTALAAVDVHAKVEQAMGGGIKDAAVGRRALPLVAAIDGGIAEMIW